MATLTANVVLPVDALPGDTLRLVIVTEPQTAVADASPGSPGSLEVTEQLVGDVEPGSTVAITGSLSLDGGCGIHHWAVSLIDEAGNVSPLWESFELLADHPDGNTGHTLSATENTNEALLTWTPGS
ncbi:MAG: hypothetical protein AAGF84_03750 [Planctomycetota bacterium]